MKWTSRSTRRARQKTHQCSAMTVTKSEIGRRDANDTKFVVPLSPLPRLDGTFSTDATLYADRLASRLNNKSENRASGLISISLVVTHVTLPIRSPLESQSFPSSASWCSRSWTSRKLR